MAEVVFVLGAGASRAAGGPLMWDFLDRARALRDSGETGAVDEHFGRVFKAIGKLAKVHSKATLDVHNLEAVFGAFEMATTLGRLGDLPQTEIDELDVSMRTVIATTLEREIKFPGSRPDRVEAPTPYPRFAALVSALRGARPPRSVAIITFNYDLCLDYAFWRGGLPHSYFLGVHDPPDSPPPVPLLKLHGSMNWREHSSTKRVEPWMMSGFFSNRNWGHLVSGRAILNVASIIREESQSGGLFSGVPFLVPPTFAKASYHRQLSSVWKRAAVELGNARDIIVIGFSLTASDEFFRHLYAIGTEGDETMRRFWVMDPDESGNLEKRYRELLGPGAEKRFVHHRVNFEDAFEVLNEAYNLKI